jgi:hypothetical protein
MIMRVPIFPEDLIQGSGFTRLAKRLKRDWLGTKPLRLSEAQEILAHCLGYSSYHDVAQSAEMYRDDIDFPPLQELMIDCLQTISAELYDNGHCKVFNLGELQENIYNWPFLLLNVYRKHYGHSDNHIVGQAIKVDHIGAFIRTQTLRPEYRPQAFKTGFSSKQLQAMMGHQDHQSTEAYVSSLLPIGVCPYDDTSEKIQELMGPRNIACIDNVSTGRASSIELLDGDSSFLEPLTRLKGLPSPH